MTSYQMLPPLNAEEHEALKADIIKRGILVPVELDEDGNILDGYNRMLIADELDIQAPTVTRVGMTEVEKREHALKLNIARRHLDPVRWGAAFKQLLELRGVRHQGRPPKDATVAPLLESVAAELGVAKRTAQYRVKMADDYIALPVEYQSAVDEGEITVSAATRANLREQNRELAKRVVPTDPSTPARCVVIDPPWDVADESECVYVPRVVVWRAMYSLFGGTPRAIPA